MLWLNSPVVNGVCLGGGTAGCEFKSCHWQLFFMGLDWIININIHWKQLGLILWTLEIQDRINPPNWSSWLPGLVIPHNLNIRRRSVQKYDARFYQHHQQCNRDWGGYVVNIPIYSPFSPLFKVSITFLISFRLPLFRLYYLKTTDIFPTFFPLNMLLI